MALSGRKPSLTPEQRAYCYEMRLKRMDGMDAPSTNQLAGWFRVCPATVRNAVRNLHAKHAEFQRRLTRMSEDLRKPLPPSPPSQKR